MPDTQQRRIDYRVRKHAGGQTPIYQQARDIAAAVGCTEHTARKRIEHLHDYWYKHGRHPYTGPYWEFRRERGIR